MRPAEYRICSHRGDDLPLGWLVSPRLCRRSAGVWVGEPQLLYPYLCLMEEEPPQLLGPPDLVVVLDSVGRRSVFFDSLSLAQGSSSF